MKDRAVIALLDDLEERLVGIVSPMRQKQVARQWYDEALAANANSKQQPLLRRVYQFTLGRIGAHPLYIMNSQEDNRISIDTGGGDLGNISNVGSRSTFRDNVVRQRAKIEHSKHLAPELAELLKGAFQELEALPLAEPDLEDAAEQLAKLREELDQEQADKQRVQRYWGRVIEIVRNVISTTGSLSSIASFLSRQGII